ncbi:hypothetical protein [Aureliella helgolandensis]|uniref:Large polyvalent protein associated domain-containing protein n=1 Tax=Aureliella helgolandensis TaxID=2527968 RepID=A0A518G861_9BACT|nr:hypothetical protein [Aureliella helgolandensis]QDV24777.1 hypothetical protein Q31a_30990 [Aureliella helgolandensis]
MPTLRQLYGPTLSSPGEAVDRMQFSIDSILRQPNLPETNHKLKEATNSTVGGGLAAAGNILDLPGSSVRDVLAFQNPLDQWLTPTSHENRTTGRDLARNFGLANKGKDTYANFFGGLGAEVLLDPLTYTGVGLLTKGGKALDAAGLAGRNVTKTANKLATETAKKSGNVMTKELGKAGARMRMTPRQVIESADDSLKAKSAWLKTRGQLTDKMVADAGDDSASLVEGLWDNIANPDKGAVDELLDKPLQSIASFRIPGLMPEAKELVPKDSGESALRKFVDKNSAKAPDGTLPPIGSQPAPPPLPGTPTQPVGDTVTRTPLAGQGLGGKAKEFLQGGGQKISEFAKSIGKFSKDWKSQLPEDLAVSVGDAIDNGTSTVMAVPAVENVVALFNPYVRGGATKMQREVGRDITESLDQATEGYRETLLPVIRKFEESKILDEPSMLNAGLSKEQAASKMNDYDRQMRNYLENYDPKNGRTGTVLPSELKPLEGELRSVRKMMDDIIDFEKESGLDTRFLDDEFVSYLARYRRDPAKAYGHNPTVGPVVEASHPSMKQREYRDMPGGVAVLQEASVDPVISGILHRNPVVKNRLDTGDIADLRQYVAQKYGDRIDADFDPTQPMKDSDTRFDAFIRSAAKWDRSYADNQTPMFGRNFVADTMRRLEDGLRVGFVARQAQTILGKSAIPTDVTTIEVGKRVGNAARAGNIASPADARAVAGEVPQAYTIKKVLEDLELNTPKARLNTINNMDEPAQAMFDDMVQRRSAEVFDELAENITEGADEVKTIRLMSGGKPAEFYLSEDGDIIRKSSKTVRDKSEGAKKGATQQVDQVDEIPIDEFEDVIRENVSPDFLDKFGVDGDTHLALTRRMKPFSSPDEVGYFAKGMHRFMNVFRSGLTAPWPAFHARNLLSGQVHNAMVGAKDPTGKGPMAYFKPLKEAYDLRNGEPIKGIAEDIPSFKGMTDEEATAKIADLAFIYGLVGDKMGLAAEHIGDSHQAMRSQVPGLNREVNPIKLKFSPAPPNTSFFDRWLNPFAVKDGVSGGAEGVAKVNDDLWMPARLGRDLSSFVEDLNRLSPFIAYMKQGMSPAKAAQLVKKNQVDYSRLSAFERNTARSAIPFYTFSSRMLPVVLEELITSPGGPMAQTVRAINRARAPEDSIPEHIASTAAIPLGTKSDGSKSYLTGFGLAFEDSLNLANGLLRMNPVETAKEIAGRSSPFIKGPAEAIFGRSLFFDGPFGGRELEDMDPTIGRTMSNVRDIATGANTRDVDPFISQGFEHAFSNSPLSRLGTTARTLTDKRKWERPQDLAMNLLTGMRVSDVSPDAQDAIYRERLARSLKDMGGRTFSRPYISDAREEAMSPEELAAAEEVLNELGVIDKRFKARREVREAEEAGRSIQAALGR